MAADDFGCGAGVAVVGRAFVAAGGPPLFNDGGKINLVQPGRVKRVDTMALKVSSLSPFALLFLDGIYVRSCSLTVARLPHERDHIVGNVEYVGGGLGAHVRAREERLENRASAGEREVAAVGRVVVVVHQQSRACRTVRKVESS